MACMSRPFGISAFRLQQEAAADVSQAADEVNDQAAEKSVTDKSVTETSASQSQKRRIVDVHTSMRYLKSKGTGS